MTNKKKKLKNTRSLYTKNGKNRQKYKNVLDYIFINTILIKILILSFHSMKNSLSIEATSLK
jgi:hypothetical protein